MKTADLIPLLLLELNNGDKYGFELTKEIETKSAGKIIIKQPTLYTVLKKLEKSKFISSYWQDSDIGGKRHYYRLTDNGKIQISTFPSYEVLIKKILENEESIDEEFIPTVEPKIRTFEQTNSEINQSVPQKEPSESILPTDEIFSNNNIDSSTEFDLNISNVEFLKNDSINNKEQFARNENVMKFADKVQSAEKIKTLTRFDEPKDNISNISSPLIEEEIKYVDYVNFKKCENYKKSKMISKKILVQSLLTSCLLLMICLICSLITKFTGHSALYYTFFMVGLIIALFYPILTSINIQKISIKYKRIDYNPNTKLKICMSIALILAVTILSIILNLTTLNLSLANMFKFNNFENVYAPLLITSVIFLDTLFNHILLSKINK